MNGDERLFQQILDALRQSEARYRHLIEHATDIIYTHTLDGRVITINKVAEQVLGYQRDELIGKFIQDLIAPEHRERSRQMMEDKLTKGTSVTYTVDAITSSGGRVPLEVNTQIIFDEGEPLAIQGIARDVTERLRTAQALQDREHFYRTITERSSDILAIIDPTPMVSYVSPSFEWVLGLKAEDIVGTAGMDVVHPDDVERANQVVADLIAQNRDSARIELRIRDATGAYRTLDVQYRNLLNDPVIRGIVIDGRDVTDRQQAQQALRASEERFRKIVETSGEGIVVRDTDGIIIFANQRMADMIGFQVEQLVGMHVDDIVSKDCLPIIHASAERRRRTGKSETLDLKFLHRDGHFVDAILAVSPTFDDKGNFTGALGMITDVTERIRLEEQLRQSQKIEAVGRLAGGVAHDFNNLLTAIRGHVELLLADIPDESEIRPDIEEIRKAADRAAGLTHQLLAFSRRQMLQPVVLEFDGVVREMESLLRRLISEDIRLVTRLNCSATRIRADRGQIEQVVMNLVVNARDAMPHGGEIVIETGDCELDAEFLRNNVDASPGSYAKLTVRDNGTGMDARTLSHVFEPFFTTKPVGQGTGLGLATVYGIVKQSGGYIRVSSEVGTGTRFEIFLPRVQDQVQPVRDAVAPNHAEARGETILVAEDENAVRALTSRILRKRGYHVLEARDGREAVEVARNHAGRISLLVTDVIMPHLGGRELSENIAAMIPDVKVLYMSGYTDDALLQRGVLQSGTGNFLEKPFTPEALANKVREVLEGE